MRWSSPVAVYIYDTFYSICGTQDAEQFFLRHWSRFRAEDRDALIMACLLSWDGHAELAAKARRKFVEAAQAAGILICAGEREQHFATPSLVAPVYFAKSSANHLQEIIRMDHRAEAGGTVSVVAGGKEFSPLGAFSSGEIAAP